MADILAAMQRAKMTPLQYAVIALCTLCNILDGYDIFVMGFVLPYLPEGFASDGEKGLLVSAGLVGMGVGAILLAPLGDRFGRRSMIIVGLTIDTIGMAACALAWNADFLIVSRFVTGTGIGIITALIMVVAAEYASVARRNAAIGVVTIGFPLGSVVAGMVSVWLMNRFAHAWQTSFWAGAVMGLVVLMLVAARLPESLAFLQSRGTPRSSQQLRRIGARMGLATVDSADDAAAVAQPARRDVGPAVFGLLGSELRERTLYLWLMYAAILAAFYFVTSWTPQLIATATGDTDGGAIVGTALSVGSLAGSLLFAAIGLRLPAIHIAWACLLIGAGGVVTFALLLTSQLAVLVAAALGLAVYTAVAAVTAMTPPLYPVELRATGYGSMLGIGRVGGIAAPVLAGYALAVMTPKGMYTAAAIPLAVAAIAVVRVWWITRVDAMAATPVPVTAGK
jgi:MFS family permease